MPRFAQSTLRVLRRGCCILRRLSGQDVSPVDGPSAASILLIELGRRTCKLDDPGRMLN
jgi:hypothetical protein